VLRHLGCMEADFDEWCWTHVMMDKVCGFLGWFGIRDTIDGWRIEARPAIRNVFDSPEQSGLILPFFANWISSSPRGLWWAMAPLCLSGWLLGRV
jgi:hypothetical protein